MRGLLTDWFRREKRKFPWRDITNPYAVWVSEVMLQQTRSSVVVSYFHRWMDRFPDISTLARADIGEVTLVWQGLGYYARARNLHRGARFVVENFGGSLPSQREKLESIPGIGSYTAGAILSFAFKKKAPAIDGNVVRVITRLFGIEGNIEEKSTREEIYHKVNDMLGPEAFHEVMEGLIELGALVCQKAPRCHACPLSAGCVAHLHGMTDRLPKKKPRPEGIRLERTVFCIRHEGKWLLQHKKHGVMEGLWQWPFHDGTYLSPSVAKEAFSGQVKAPLEIEAILPPVMQTFTKFKVRLIPLVLEAGAPFLLPGFEWKTEEEIPDLPFCAGHRKILLHFFTIPLS